MTKAQKPNKMTKKIRHNTRIVKGIYDHDTRSLSHQLFDEFLQQDRTPFTSLRDPAFERERIFVQRLSLMKVALREKRPADIAHMVIEWGGNGASVLSVPAVHDTFNGRACRLEHDWPDKFAAEDRETTKRSWEMWTLPSAPHAGSEGDECVTGGMPYTDYGTWYDPFARDWDIIMAMGPAVEADEVFDFGKFYADFPGDEQVGGAAAAVMVAAAGQTGAEADMVEEVATMGKALARVDSRVGVLGEQQAGSRLYRDVVKADGYQTMALRSIG